MRLSYPYNGNSYPGKMVTLHWDSALHNGNKNTFLTPNCNINECSISLGQERQPFKCKGSGIHFNRRWNQVHSGHADLLIHLFVKIYIKSV